MKTHISAELALMSIGELQQRFDEASTKACTLREYKRVYTSETINNEVLKKLETLESTMRSLSVALDTKENDYLSYIKENGPDSVIVPLFVDNLIEMRACDYDETHKKIRQAMYDYIVSSGKPPSKEKILEIAAQV